MCWLVEQWALRFALRPNSFLQSFPESDQRGIVLTSGTEGLTLRSKPYLGGRVGGSADVFAALFIICMHQN